MNFLVECVCEIAISLQFPSVLNLCLDFCQKEYGKDLLPRKMLKRKQSQCFFSNTLERYSKVEYSVCKRDICRW